MMDGIKEEAVGFLFYVQVNIEELAATDDEIVEVEGDESVTAIAPPVPISPSPPADRPAQPGPWGTAPAVPPAPPVDAPYGTSAQPAQPGQPATAPPAAAAAAAAPALEPGSERERVSDVIGRAIGGSAPRPSNLSYSAPSLDGEGGVQRSEAPATGEGGGSFANASRNQPCPCGSGRKFKRCHGAPGGAAAN